MYAVEKKYDIEMKLKKEMSNIQELKAAAGRSSALAGDVCNVLGACEQRLQQLEGAVLPLYGDTARLQQIHQNMERTAKALDQVINYYMVARELADLIQGGPYTSSPEALNGYLEALDKLSEAQTYFNKNNPTSVELENINQLYNTGVAKLENVFEELLCRNTRPLSPATLMDMIALEEDSSVESVSVSGSNSSNNPQVDALRAMGAWLSACGRPPAAALVAARGPCARAALNAFRDYLRTRSMGTDTNMRAKNLLHRSDSTKKTSRIQKVLEKRANKIMMKASQTLEQSTGLAIGPRRSMNDSYSEETEQLDEQDAETGGDLAAALCKLARNEQRFLLGLVPLSKLPQVLTATLNDALLILQNHVERSCNIWSKLAGSGSALAAHCWLLVSRLQRHAPNVERAFAPAPPTLYHQLLQRCTKQCTRGLDEWVSAVEACCVCVCASDVTGTVHTHTHTTLTYLTILLQHVNVIGPALLSEAGYSRAASQYLGVQDRNALTLAIYMRKVLAQLNLALRNKSEQYNEALKAIFLLNNTLYMLQGLQRTGLMEVLMLAEPECEMNYRDMLKEYKNSYLQTWNKLVSHTSVDDVSPQRLRDSDRKLLKDKFAAFNRELEETTKAQRTYSVPDLELRETLKREIKQTLLPPYSKFHDTFSQSNFSKNPDKYIKYTPVQVATQLDGYFDEAA